MRFGKNNYPLLCDPLFRFNKDDDISQIVEYNEIRKKSLKILNLTGVKYISSTFAKEADKNYDKLTNYVHELQDFEFALCIDRLFIIGVHGHAYFVFDKKDIIAFMLVVDLGKDEERIALYPSKKAKLAAVGAGYKIEDWASYLMAEIKSCCIFEKYAQLKTKELEPGKKIKDFNCRYKSDILYPVQLLTENWYVESCRNHPFLVRGHWRMQAHGKGMKDRKLTWIDAFTKQGYTKGAYKNKL